MSTLVSVSPASPGYPRAPGLRRPGYADEVALRVGEVPDHQAGRCPLGTHHALPAQALGPLQGGLDIGHANVEHRVGLVSRATADATGDPGPVAGGVAVHEAVVVRLRHRLRDRGAGVELPPEQFAEVAPELRRLLSDDLEVHNRLRHGYSLRAGRAPPAGAGLPVTTATRRNTHRPPGVR